MKPNALAVLVVFLAFGGVARPVSAVAGEPAAQHNMQGDQSAWINNPHMHAFYDLTVAAFANGPSAVDRAKFEADAHRIFRAFAVSMHMDPAGMEDHLKLIPAQVIQIATDDPKVLSSYDAFVVAVFGPQ